MIQTIRKYAPTLLKVLVTLVGLAYALSEIDFATAFASLKNVAWQGVVWVLVLSNVSLAVRAGRWWMLLRGLGAKIGLGRLTALYFAGNFFNIFLPSGFGGDVVRAVEAARDVPASTAAGTVLVDRLTGLMTLFALTLLILPFRPPSFPDWQAWLVGGVALAGLVGGMALLSGWLVKVAEWILPAKLSLRRVKTVDQLLSAVEGCGWRAIGQAMGVSLVFNVMLIAWWTIAGKALGYDVPVGYYALVVPIMSLVLILPSIGGLGVRESIAPVLFAGAGLSSTEAVTLALLIFTLLRLSGLLGAPVYVWLTMANRRSD